jgi:nucleoside-diphosphate-sugar epimerase
MIRKALEASDSKGAKVMEVWGTGRQTRSFLYIDDCIEAVRRLMDSEYRKPINIGSEESISINGLASIAVHLVDAWIEIRNIAGPVGVNGRNSNNDTIRKVLQWEPTISLEKGMRLTYDWIKTQYAHSF